MAQSMTFSRRPSQPAVESYDEAEAKHLFELAVRGARLAHDRRSGGSQAAEKEHASSRRHLDGGPQGDDQSVRCVVRNS
jgi:hypothetical protein